MKEENKINLSDMLDEFRNGEKQPGSTPTEAERIEYCTCPMCEFCRSEKAMKNLASKEVQQSDAGWVSVEDGLPEIGSTVLTFPSFKVLPFGNIEKEAIGEEKIDKDFWEWQGDSDTGGEVVAYPYPSHWMPLPAPPKQ